MPIFKIDSKLFYFAHVPKCGGTSIENGLIDSGISLSFYDPEFWKLGEGKWYNSSPQHIPLKSLERLFEMEIFDYKFTCVRDPVTRFLSSFNHNRQKSGGISKLSSVEGFLSRLEGQKTYFSYRFDNHFVPASDIVPNGCKVFYLERGLGEISNWLSEASNGIISANFEHHNKKEWNGKSSPSTLKRIVKKNFQPKIPQVDSLNQETIDRIKELYRNDYKRFFKNW